MALIAYLIGVFVSVVLWQHFAKVVEFWFTPVWILNTVRQYCETVFRLLGSWFAYISSYLTYLKLDKLFSSACDVLKALWCMLFVWAEFVKGYYNAIFEYQWSTSTIVCGSITIIAAIAYIVYRFRTYLFTQAFRARVLQAVHYAFPSRWTEEAENNEDDDDADTDDE